MFHKTCIKSLQKNCFILQRVCFNSNLKVILTMKVTMKVNFKHYCKLIMTFVTNVETYRHSWSKSSKLIKKDFAPPIMGSILKRRNNTYNVRNFQEFETGRKRTVYFGLETISYRSRQLWSLLPEHIRQFILNSLKLNSIDQFKISVRQWVCNSCPCRLCKVYLQNIGFL